MKVFETVKEFQPLDIQEYQINSLNNDLITDQQNYNELNFEPTNKYAKIKHKKSLNKA